MDAQRVATGTQAIKVGTVRVLTRTTVTIGLVDTALHKFNPLHGTGKVLTNGGIIPTITFVIFARPVALCQFD